MFLYIVRSEDLGVSEDNPITEEELLTYVAKDEEMFEHPDPDWKGEMVFLTIADEYWPLNFYDGRISSPNKTMSNETINSMVEKFCEIAKALNARVFGDAGEVECSKKFPDKYGL